MATKKKLSEVALKYTVEAEATKELNAINQKVTKGFEGLESAIKRGGVAGVQQIKSLSKESGDLGKDLRGIRREFQEMKMDVPDALDKAINKVDELNAAVKRGTGDIRDFDEEFSQVSQQVGLIGDAESNLRATSGVAGFVGGAGAARGIAAVAEVPAAIEGLARLKPAMVGLPSAAKSAATALGPTGLGLAAVAVAGAVVFSSLSKNMNQAKEAARALAEQTAKNAETAATLEQSLGRGDLEAAGQQVRATLDELERRNLQRANLEQELAEARIQALMEEKNLTREAAELMSQRLGEKGLRDFFDDADKIDEKFADLIGSTSQATFNVRALQDQVDSLSEGELMDLNFAFATQRETLEEYGVTLADVMAATEEVTEAEEKRNEALLALAADRRSDILREQSLLEQSSDQLTDRLDAIEEERMATEAAIKVLQESGETTEDVTQAMENYNSTLKELGEEQAFINEQALNTARIRESQEASEEKAIELAEERAKLEEELAEQTEASLKERAKIEKDFADDLVKLSEDAAKKSEEAWEKLQEKLSDINMRLQRDLENQDLKAQRKQLEAQVNAQRQAADSFRKHTQSLNDIRDKSNQDAEDAAQSRNFAAVFNIRKNARRAVQDQQKQFSREREDTTINEQRKAQDRQTAFAQERQDRLRKFQQDIADANQKFAIEREQARVAAIEAINTRRQQFQQETADLQAASNAQLQIKRALASEEMAIISTTVQTALSLFGSLQAAAQSAFASMQSASTASSFNEFSDTPDINAFNQGGFADTFGTSTTNNASSDITINAASNQSEQEIAGIAGKEVERVFNRILS